MQLMKVGLVAAVVGVIGALVNLWARHAFPDRWGGPNIGGGFLQLLFYLLIAAGVVLAAAGGLRIWRSKQNG